MNDVCQIVYLAPDGSWQFRDPELPAVDALVEPVQAVPAFWDPALTVPLSEWLPRPNKRFVYAKLRFPVTDWFPELEGEAQQIAGLKLVIAVAEEALKGLLPQARETEIREVEAWPEWLTRAPRTRRAGIAEQLKEQLAELHRRRPDADFPRLSEPSTEDWRRDSADPFDLPDGMKECRSFNEWHGDPAPQGKQEDEPSRD